VGHSEKWGNLGIKKNRKVGWVRMGSDGFGWVRMGSDGFGWVRMGSDGFGWARMGSDGLGWVRMGSDNFGVFAAWPCFKLATLTYLNLP
jgi:hypothetical protein